MSLEERERTSETGDRGACREKSPSLLCRDEPRAAYIDGETEGKCSLGMTAESRSKFGAQKRKKKKYSQESSRCIPSVLRTHTCTHTQHIMYNMPDRWLKETSTRGVIKTKPMVVLEGSPGTWRGKRPPYLTVMCAHISHKPRSYSDRKEKAQLRDAQRRATDHNSTRRRFAAAHRGSKWLILPGVKDNPVKPCLCGEASELQWPGENNPSGFQKGRCQSSARHSNL